MLSASVLTLFLVGLSSFPHLAASTANNLAGATTLDPVQLSIQTKNITAVSSYDLVAYNSSGAPVASYTGQYPRVTLDLPSGTYLFAATAYGPAPDQPMVCCVCAQSGVASTSSPPPLKTSPGNSAPSAIAMPCYGGNQALEYGYSLTQVSGSSSLTIDTQPPASFPTTDVSVSVSYKNGTAASGADVYASAIGGYLSWGDNSNLELYTQTGANGVAHLVVPAVPLTVTASESVQVNLTESQKTVQVNIGGQPVNVTVYYSPSYVYLSASALLIPPQTSLSMVLSAQTPYQRILYGAGAASSVSTPNSSQVQPGAQAGAAVATSGDSGSNATAKIAAIPPIPASAHASSASTPASSQAASSPSGVTLLAIGTLAVAGAAAAIVGVAISKSRR